MQYFRRIIQISVILLLIVIPFINYYGVMIHQKNDFAIENSFILSAIHSFFIGQDREEVVEMTHNITGSIWTMDIMGFKISDPLAALESSAITLYLYLPLLLSIIIPVVLTIVLGKVYCGWICPMNLLLEINDWFRKLLSKTGYNTRDVNFSKNTKYWILVLGIIIAFFAGRPLLALIYPPAIISRVTFYKIYNGIWGSGILILTIIFFIELILSRRWWCRYICPGGAVYTVLSKFSLLRIKRFDESCDSCGDCIPVCPYDLKPMTKTLGMDCDQCGKCIDVCKPGALEYKFKLKYENNDYGSDNTKISNESKAPAVDEKMNYDPSIVNGALENKQQFK
ncbi:MAG: 4Fe-4S binding protein [bacterium]|nr:4Fe-4S binding protein [bacterium]